MRSERDALNAMEAHALEARTFLEQMSLEEFRSDRRTFHAVTRCLEIISEASRRLSDDLKSRHPQIRWRDMADARNVHRHAYESVAADFVFKTATQDLVEVLAAVHAELGA